MMRRANLALIAVAFALYFVVFGRQGGARAILFFLPFSMTPFIVTAVLACFWRSNRGQAMLLLTSLAYAAWFIFLYIDSAILHPDPQSPIAFLFVAIYATPVLLILWIIGWLLNRRQEATRSPLASR